MGLTQVSTGGIKNATIKNEDIEADTVQLTKIQNMATNHILGRSTSGTGNPEILSGAQTRTILNVENGANQTTINNNADNRVITGSGTANTLNGESGLSFDGSTMNLTAASGDARLSLFGTEGNDARITLCADEGDDHIDQYNIESRANNDFVIDQFESGSRVDRLTIANGGKIGINVSTPQQQLHVHDDTNYQGIFVNGNAAPRVAFSTSNSSTPQWSLGIDGTNDANFVINRSGGNSNRDVIISPNQITLNKNTIVSGTCTATSFSGSGANLTGISAGITMAEQWRLTSSSQGNQTPLTNWEAIDTYGEGNVGSSMSVSNGIFTYPTTGRYLVIFFLVGYSDSSTQNLMGYIQHTTNNSNYNTVANGLNGIYDFSNSYPSWANTATMYIFNISATGQHKTRFVYGAGQGNEYVHGNSSTAHTTATFIRLAD